MKKSVLALALLTLSVTGCAKQTFVMDDNSKEMDRNDVFFSENILDPNIGADSTTHEHFFISGLGQGKSVNPVEVCGSVTKIAKVEVQQNFLQAILSGITFGIYTPRDARVYCK